MSFCLTSRLALTYSLFFFCLYVSFFFSFLKQKVKVCDAICLKSFSYIGIIFLVSLQVCVETLIGIKSVI